MILFSIQQKKMNKRIITAKYFDRKNVHGDCKMNQKSIQEKEKNSNNEKKGNKENKKLKKRPNGKRYTIEKDFHLLLKDFQVY